MDSCFPGAGKSRREICYEAARIMAEEGIRDFQRAKEKACARLGVKSTRNLPTNTEIESELATHLDLFAGGLTRKLREDYVFLALELMECIEEFAPKLTGAALSGNITSSRPIEIQAFPSTVDELCAVLDESGINFQLTDKRIRLVGGKYTYVPAAKFTNRRVDFEILIFAERNQYPVLSPINGRIMPRASLKRVRRMAKELSDEVDTHRPDGTDT